MTPTPLSRRSRIVLLRAGLALAVVAAVPGVGRAQLVRPIPEAADVGRLRIGVFPEATLDGREIRLGPGTRIRDENNMIKPPGTLAGEHRIAYVRGTLGEIVEVWLVSDAEYRAVAARAAARRAAQPR